MKRSRVLFLAFMIFIFLSFLAIAVLAIQAGAAQGGQPFDLVILLDVSGSLPTTDPNSLNVQVARLATEYLQKALDGYTDSRVALVPFAADVDDTLGLKTIPEFKLEEVLPVTFTGRTDFVKALQAAADILQESQPERRRVVLLITDGEPDLPALKDRSSRLKYLWEEVGPLIAAHATDFELWVVGVGKNEYEEFWAAYRYSYHYYAVRTSEGLAQVVDAMTNVAGLGRPSRQVMAEGTATLDLPERKLVTFIGAGLSRDVTGTVTLTNKATGETEALVLGGKQSFYLLRPLEGKWELRFSHERGEVLHGVMVLPLPALTPTPSAMPTPLPVLTPTPFAASELAKLLQIGEIVFFPRQPRSGQSVHIYVPVTAATSVTNVTVLAQVRDGGPEITTELSPETGGFGKEIGPLDCPFTRWRGCRYNVLVIAQAQLPRGQWVPFQKEGSILVSSGLWIWLRQKWFCLPLVAAVCYALSRWRSLTSNIALYKLICKLKWRLVKANVYIDLLVLRQKPWEEQMRERRKLIRRILIAFEELIARKTGASPEAFLNRLESYIQAMSKLFDQMATTEAQALVRRREHDPLARAVEVIQGLEQYTIEPSPEVKLIETLRTIASITEYGVLYEPVAAIALFRLLKKLPQYETSIMDTLFIKYDFPGSVLYWAQFV